MIALLALLVVAVPAWGQDDPSERPKSVKKVYRDYRDDGAIEACDHTQDALQKTLDGLPPEADVDTPDLRPALEAAIEQVQQNDCPEPTPSPTPSPSPAPPPPASTPAPVAPDTGGNDDSLGTIPPPGGNDNDDGGGNTTPPGSDDVTPLDPEVTPVPPATTPAPPPLEPSGPEATPSPVYDNPDDKFPIALLVLGGLAVLLALLALLYAALSRLGWGERWLTRVRRAGREAAFRAGGTWGDFADWIRVGR